MEQTFSALGLETSEGFTSWLEAQNCSLLLTTYQLGKVLSIGRNSVKELAISERTFKRCMGLCVSDNFFYMSSLFQIWRFENILPPNQTNSKYDKVYVPQTAYTTGKLDVHDIIINTEGEPVFINTLFNCLATVSDTHSFKALWKPQFITELIAEDRCHLNGLAAVNNKPKFVTLVSKSNKKGEWRNGRTDGGLVIDIGNNEIVCKNLSMPHSPRWYKNKLWLLESGTGYFGFVDFISNKFEKVCFCPGFLRGLSFIGDFAIVGLSKNRENKTFQDLNLESNLKFHNYREPHCGVVIINITTGMIIENIYFNKMIRELYDVSHISKVTNPLLIGTQAEDIQKLISFE